jgi:hypothetical protein
VLRRALIALVAVALLAAGGVYLAYNYLDVAVKWTLEHYGPDVTGVSVKVREVQISPRNGRGSVRALELGNPPGFGPGPALRFGEIRLAIAPATVTQPVVTIQELAVENAAILYERGNGATNLETIQKNIEAYVKAASSLDGGKAEPAARAKKRRFVVERLTLKGAKVTMTNPALKGQGITFELPDMTLRDVGKRQGGLTASELANVVADALMQRIAQKVLTNIELLRKGGVEGAIDALKGLFR